MSRYIEIKDYNFKGFLNIDTGDITYSTISPKYKRVLNADLKINIRDTETFNNKNILNKAKTELRSFLGSSDVMLESYLKNK